MEKLEFEILAVFKFCLVYKKVLKIILMLIRSPSWRRVGMGPTNYY